MTEMADSGVSEVFGKEVGLVHKAIVTGRKVGAGKAFWTALADDEEMFRRVVELVNIRPTYDVVVDYSRSLAQMIKAGRYDEVNDNITADNFPVKGEGEQEVEITLFHFNWVMTSNEVRAEMDKEGFRPAELPELLALGKDYPDLQRKSWIVALGHNSIWVTPRGRCVSCLDEHPNGRGLILDYFSNRWGTHFCFAAVRK